MHILNHAHIYDQNVVSDAYKASDATYGQPATYYKSCVCGAKGTETFTSGEALEPVITAGANGTWQKGAKDGLSFTSSAPFADFLNVQVDGKDIDATNYDVKEGSTIVILKTSYLQTLSVGNHTLAIVSDTGTATTEFTIQAAASADDTQSPQTHDNNNVMLWIVVMMAAGAGLTATAVCRRKRHYPG